MRKRRRDRKEKVANVLNRGEREGDICEELAGAVEVDRGEERRTTCVKFERLVGVGPAEIVVV